VPCLDPIERPVGVGLHVEPSFEPQYPQPYQGSCISPPLCLTSPFTGGVPFYGSDAVGFRPGARLVRQLTDVGTVSTMAP
jgi:hypothetical protein